MGNSGGATTKATNGTNNVTRVQLPAWYEGQIQSLANAAQGIYGQRSGQAYPSMYVGMDPITQRGLGMVERTAGAHGGSMVPGAALSEWQRTVGGEYMRPDSNPWLREIADRAGYEAENRVNSQYATGGASMGGAYANALADAQTGTRASLYGANYEAERARMQAALGMAPMAENLQYADAARLGMVGQRREEDALTKAAEANRQYMKPWDEMGKYADVLYGNPAQREVTASESGVKTEKTTQKNKFDWAAFTGSLFA